MSSPLLSPLKLKTNPIKKMEEELEIILPTKKTYGWLTYLKKCVITDCQENIKQNNMIPFTSENKL